MVFGSWSVCQSLSKFVLGVVFVKVCQSLSLVVLGGAWQSVCQNLSLVVLDGAWLVLVDACWSLLVLCG